MKEEKILELLNLMLHHLSKAKRHLDISFAFSIFGILYALLSATYIFGQEEVSILNLFLVWLTLIVVYRAQVKGRKEYDFHMEKHKKLKEEYEDLISR